MAASASELVRLDGAATRAALERYRAWPAFFPLIGAVLAGDQDGQAWGDRPAEPRQVYVEHAFGFAQVFGAEAPGFEEALRRYLLVDRRFAASKVRLYTPALPSFLAGAEGAPLRSERQRFALARPAPAAAREGALDAVWVDAGNAAELEPPFDVARRFWRSAADFAAGALAVVARVDGQPAAMCYAAAVCDGRAEIDVLTLPAHRQRGAGRFAVAHFAERCRAQGIAPLWDCFTNNEGSMQLCRSAGFTAAGPAYPFFTIGK